MLDQFPDNPAAAIDVDLDGLVDEWNSGCDLSCQDRSGLTLDSNLSDADNDGVLDSEHPNANGLISVDSLFQLHAIRYSLDGVGRRMSAEGELDTTGCPAVLYEGILQRRCHGYELTSDLDFDTNGDGVLDEQDEYWNGGSGWESIGDSENGFQADFDGNGYVIRNLNINRSEAPSGLYQGLFGYTQEAQIQNLGLTGSLTSISGHSYVGALVGYADATIIDGVFSTGRVRGNSTNVGGLVGRITGGGQLRNAFSTGSVASQSSRVGGLVGFLYTGEIKSSYSTGHVEGAGGLLGAEFQYSPSASVKTSYWTTDTPELSESGAGVEATLAELQCPIAASDTSCAEVILYEQWIQVESADGHAYWNFGTHEQLPALVLEGKTYHDSDGDGALDEDDAFPRNPSATVDADEDGLPDEWRYGCDSDCQTAYGLTLDKHLDDTDNDGVINDEDDFPQLAEASVDTDGDGNPDAWSESCDTTCQSGSGLTLDMDNDGDGIDNDVDAFPLVAAASKDEDDDGLADAWLEGCDSDCQTASGLMLDKHLDDTDNDGVINDEDDFPQLAEASVDTDGDGNPDAWSESCDATCQSTSVLTLDKDKDGDGVNNDADAFPLIAAASMDADEDGLPDAWHEGCGTTCQGDSGLVLDEHIDDTDNDGVINDDDDFPQLAEASVDTDGDRNPDTWNESCDVTCQSSSALILDTDNDGDGVDNDADAFPLIAAASKDADEDGLPDAWHEGCDTDCEENSGLTLDDHLDDTDNDGVVNDEDDFPQLAEASVDTDGDGNPDAWNGNCDATCQSESALTLDTDNDGDGINNDADAFPLIAAASVDVDEDGFPDAWNEGCDSTCESESGLTLDERLDDTDNDGAINGADDFPLIAAASLDTDEDGLPDAWHDGCATSCQDSSGLTLDGHPNDTDNDGAVNEQDTFPGNPAASVDADEDGLPDAWHEGCDIDCQESSGLTLDDHLDDTDNDGVVNDKDDFPQLAEASVDTDGDGNPDAWNGNCDATCQSESALTLDTDNDGDGINNDADAFPLIAAASVDVDEDGLPDAWRDGCDTSCQDSSGLTLDGHPNDTDNDGAVNEQDAFPANPAASVDADEDSLPDAWHEGCDTSCQEGSGLTLDEHPNDTDNDGFVNSEDAYPNNPALWEDDQAPEMVEVPESIKVAATGETTRVTLRVQDALGYDNFDSQVNYEVSLADEALTMDADNRVELPSGALTLQWRAVDDAGNRSEPMEQAVNVYPLVRFGQAESTTGENKQARIAVTLSGPSPEYPIEVSAAWIENDSTANLNDLVTDGEQGVDPNELTVVIEFGEALEEEAALIIPVARDDEFEIEETLRLEIQSARAGESDAFEMPVDEERRLHTLTLTDENLAPSLTLRVLQDGQPVEVVDPEAGQVTIEAEVDDPNGGDEHTLEWQTGSLPVAPGGAARFRFDPADLDEGDYQVSATAFDNGNPVLSSGEVTLEWSVEAATSEEEETSEEETEEETNEGNSGGDNNSNGGDEESSGGGSGGGGQVSLWLLMALLLMGLSRQRAVRRK
ncbi:GLUG motif-containing protein [Marinimicrobium locisalis]|uniref:GLUG motif-containing protein n=1 Tax=Marinimicrobium locisalis TaxID=546022 RepID=UPI0032216DB3